MNEIVKTAALEELNKALRTIRNAGMQVVAVVADYVEGDARFHTYMEVWNDPTLGLTTDHVMLDANRELANEWSAVAHK